MSYYSKKRQKAGLSKSEVANMLGISYNKYNLIDRGFVNMPNKFIDTFNKIVNKSDGEKIINRLNREQVVNDWWDKVSVKKSHGKYVLNEYLEKFNINNYNELANLLGFKSSSTIISALTGRTKISFNFKNRIYSFFEDELNIQEYHEKPKSGRKKQTTVNKQQIDIEKQELQAWYKSYDFKAFMKQNNLISKDVIKETGIPTTTLYYYIQNRNLDFCPKTKNIEIIKNFVENYDSDKSLVDSSSELEKDNNNIDTVIGTIESICLDDMEIVDNTNEENNNEFENTDLLMKHHKLEDYIETQLARAKAEVINYENMLKIIRGE